MITATEALSIAEIVFFVPALALAVYVCTRHGFKREAGWFLLIIISLIRLVGASCGIAAAQTQDQGVYATSLIMNSVGSATLVAAFTGITNRIAQGSKGSPLSPRQRKMIQLLGIASIVLGIVGGTKVASDDANTRSDGQLYLKIAVIFILVQLLVSIVVLVYSGKNLRDVMEGDRKLFYCAATAVPFLLARIIYSVLAAFDSNSSVFNMLSTTTTALIVRACLGLAMEFIVVALFLLAGVISPKIEKAHHSVEEKASLMEGWPAQNTQYTGQIPPTRAQ